MSELLELISLVELHIFTEYPQGTWVPASEKVATAFLAGQKRVPPQPVQIERPAPSPTPKPLVEKRAPQKKEEPLQAPEPSVSTPVVPHPHRDAVHKETPDLSEIGQTLQKLFPRVQLRKEPLKEVHEGWKSLYPKYAFISFTKSPQAALFVEQVVEAVHAKIGATKRYVALPASLSEVITQIHVKTLQAVIFCLEPSERSQVTQWVNELGVTTGEATTKEILRKRGTIQELPVYEVELPEEPQKALQFKAALWQELKACLTHP